MPPVGGGGHIFPKFIEIRSFCLISRADLGIPRGNCNINRPDPERSEKDPVLSTAWGVPSGILRNN